MADPNYDYKGGRHHKVRAVGRLYVGPIQAVGYDNRVIELSINDVEFKNSVDAERFIARQVKKPTSKNGLMRQRKMKLQSISSD